MIQRASIGGVVRMLNSLHAEAIPKAFRRLADRIITVIIAEGQANMNGRLQEKNGVHAALARYFGAALKSNVEYSRDRITTGLPADDEQARIIAHTETGGRIVPRKRQFLRIATPAALLPSGFERGGFTGVSLHDRIGTPANPFTFERPKRASVVGMDDGVAIPWNRGDGVLALVVGKGKNQRSEIRYILKRYVDRKAHKNVENALKVAYDRIPELANATMDELMKGLQ